MNFTKTINFDDTLIELSEFTGRSAATEWYAYIHTTNLRKTFDEQLSDICRSLDELITDYTKGAQCMMVKCHVSDAANQSGAIKEKLGNCAGCQISVIQQPPLDGTKLAVGIYAVSNVRKVNQSNNSTEMTHNEYHHFWATETGACDCDSYKQTADLFENYCIFLASKKMSLKDNCKRTWLYVNDIDNNYADVVRGRNDVFDKENLTENTHYIASTGIAGYSDKKGANVIFNTYSVKGLQPEQTKYLYATTHLNRTSEYGVRFERGVAINYGDRTHALISGTASIDNKGAIVFPGNVAQQTKRMLENVDKLLKEADMTLDENVMQMTVYLRDLADYTIIKELFDSRFPQTPKAIVLAPVCRPGWLIEMECVCIKDNKNSFADF